MQRTLYCMEKNVCKMPETHYSFQSPGITEVPTVLFMADDPGHSLAFTLK